MIGAGSWPYPLSLSLPVSFELPSLSLERRAHNRATTTCGDVAHGLVLTPLVRSIYISSSLANPSMQFKACIYKAFLSGYQNL